MKFRRLIATALAGFLAVTSIDGWSVTARAADFTEEIISEEIELGTFEEETPEPEEEFFDASEKELFDANNDGWESEEHEMRLEEEPSEQELLVEEDAAFQQTEYEVTLHLNGGHFIGEEESEQTYNLIYRIYDEDDYGVVYLYVDKDGYAFTGWYKDPECTEPVNDEYKTEDYKYHSNTIAGYSGDIYAGWTEDYYTITLDAGDEGYVTDDGSITEKSEHTWVLKVPKDSGKTLYYYDFKEHYDEYYTRHVDQENYELDEWKDSNGNTFTPYMLRQIIPTKDMTYTAVFLPKYSITYDAGDGYFDDSFYDDEFDFNEGRTWCYTQVKEGKWLDSHVCIDSDGNERSIYIPADPISNDKKKAFEGWINTATGFLMTVKQIENTRMTGSLNFKASYSHAYTVTFDAGEGTFSNGENIAEYTGLLEGKAFGNFYGYPDEPVIADDSLIFEDWYLDKELTQKISKTEIIEYKAEADTTFYAGYVKACTVTFHANGGEFVDKTEDTVVVKVPEGKTIGAMAPVVKGADSGDFTGWYTDSAATSEAINPQKYAITGNTDLYAGYTDDGYFTITFKSGKDYASFKNENGKAEVVVKVKKGEALTYGKTGINGSADVATSPIIDFTESVKEKGYTPTSYWLLEGTDDKYYFSRFGGLAYVSPQRVDKNGNVYDISETGFIPDRDMTFVAEWKDSITVSFIIPDGGTISDTAYLYNASVKVSSDQYLKLKTENGISKLLFTTYSGVLVSRFSYYAPSVQSIKTDNGYIYYSWGYDKDGKSIPTSTVLTKDLEVYTKTSTGSGTEVEHNIVELHAMDGKMVSRSIGYSYGIKKLYENEMDTYSCHVYPQYNTPAHTYGGYYMVANDPDKAFAGWYTDPEFTNPYPYTKTTAEVEYICIGEGYEDRSFDLYAKYVDAYRVSFDANGGYFDIEGYGYTRNPSDTIRGDYLETAKVAPGKTVMVSSYTKRIRNESNKTFGGWYLDEACTQKPTFTILDTSMNQYYKPDKNVTLYAKWVDYSKDSAVKLESDMTLGIGQKGKITIKSDLKDARITYHLMRISYGSTNTRREMPVVIDNTGVVIGQAEGSVLMCVDVNGVISNSITLTVSSEAADASIELTADKTTISKDDVIEIKAIVTPETLENSTFVWKSSNEKAAKVEGMGTTAKVTGLGEGTTEISASVGKLTAKITITVVDPVTVSKDSIFLTNIEGAKDSFVVTVKDHTQEEAAVTAVLYNNSEEEADFAEITAQSQSYNGGVGTYTFQVLPKSVGEGYIRITTAKGRYALVNIKVSDLQQAMPVSMYGQDVAEVEETDGAVTNGTKISLYSETRGSVIRYKAEYSLDNSFAEIKAEDLTEEYLDPISISWSSTEGFVRITAMASKEGLADSDIVSMVFSIDNSDAWLDVYEEDRDLFDDNFENVKNSGLIFGHIPTNIPYTGEEITFSNEDIRVYFNGRLLTAGKDYKVVYANNLNAASAPESLNGLTDSQKNRLPRVSVSAIGKYDGKIIRYFSILKRSINDTYVGSNGEITAVAEKFKSVSDPVVRIDLSDGNAKTLKAGKDYEVFYNRIDGETVDYSKALTAAELKSEILDRAAKKLAPYSYVINFRGIGNFEGDYETDAVGIGAAPRLTIISEQDVKDGILQLGNAKLSKKVPTMVYTRDAEGEAKVLSKDIAKLLSSGDIQVKVGKTVINYAEDESKIKADGYYFEIVDPADNDAAINRYPGSNNFLVLRATPTSEGSAYSNKLVGDYRVAFTITGTKINARFVASSVAYTGEPLLVYEEEEDNFILNRAKSLLNIYSNDKKADNAGAKTAQAYIQNGKEVKVLEDDEYNMYAENDIGAAGTVTVVFEGVNQKGIIGKVTKKIKVAAKKITSSDKNLVVNFDEYVNPDDVPYSKTGAAPGVIVSYNGQELVEGRDFTVSYASNTKVGATGKVNLKFTGNYSGTVKAIKTFKVGKGEFNTVNIDADSKDKAYKEKAGGYFKSVPVLSDNGKKLSLNKDYKIVDAPVYTYAEDIIEKDKNGNTTYIRTAGMEIPDDEIVHLGAVIRVRFTAIPTEKSSYKAAQYGGKDAPTEFTCEYTIGSVDLSKCSVKIADQYYAGGEGIEPAKTDITVKYGKTILDPTDFEIYRIDNNTEVGTATIILQGNGTYFGTKKATFKIKKGIVK